MDGHNAAWQGIHPESHAGRASSLLKVGYWFVDGDDLTGALHVL